MSIFLAERPARALRGIQVAILAAILVVASFVGGWYAATYLLRPAPPAPPPSIKMGLLTHLTGPVAPTGTDMLRGFVLAVEEINAAGGVFVREFGTRLKIEPIIEDQQSSLEGSIAAAQRLVTVHKVDIIVGGFGSIFVVGLQPIIAEAKTPYVITGVSTPRVVERTDIDASWFFLYQEIGPGHGASISLILAEAVRPVVAPGRNLRTAVLFQDSPFGADFWKGMEGITKEKNLPIEWVYVSKFKVGETDYRSLLTAAWAAKPDVIVPVGFLGETIAAIQQGVRDLGITTLYGPVCVCVDEVTYYAKLGKEGEYSLMQTFYGPYHESPVVKEKVESFRKRFRERWGVLPGSMGISVYDAVFVAAKAIENAGTLEKAKVRDALAVLEMDQLLIPVPGGKIKFGAKRQQGFELYGVQLLWDESVKELRPVIIWPAKYKKADLKLPPGYKPGG